MVTTLLPQKNMVNFHKGWQHVMMWGALLDQNYRREEAYSA